MTEERVGYLCNIAFSITPNNESLKLLRSYYLMRCNELTRGYGLPMKHFSTKSRCLHCCLEWTKETKVKVHPWGHGLKKQVKEKNDLPCRNEMEQICTFCGQSTTTQLVKPEKEYVKLRPREENKLAIMNSQHKQIVHKAKKATQVKKVDIKKQDNKNIKLEKKKDTVVNVYSNAFDVFSLKNDNNTLSGTIKEPAKVIKNNKKKKDRYAGLCQKAVLASSKLKQQKETQKQHQTTQSKLNLFLKPSVD